MGYSRKYTKILSAGFARLERLQRIIPRAYICGYILDLLGGYFMELYPENYINIKDVLRASRSPYLFYIAAYIDKLEKENIDREESAIRAYSDLHYWRDKARNAEKERDLAVSYLKQVVNELGLCWGCKRLDEATDECTSPEGRLMCDTKTNNMWEWKGLEK